MGACQKNKKASRYINRSKFRFHDFLRFFDFTIFSILSSLSITHCFASTPDYKLPKTDILRTNAKKLQTS